MMLLTGALAALRSGLGALLTPDPIPSEFWYLLIFFVFFTSVFHYGLLKSCEGQPGKFIRYFMAATTIKLLIFISILVVYGLVKKRESIPFILTFFALYMCYSVFEVSAAYGMLKSKPNVPPHPPKGGI